jgi:F-type H+-transporting ATPase subunit epsilon
LAKTFRCSIVTPEAAVLDEDVAYASFPAWDGQHGMMPGQSPLLARLGTGSLRLDFPPSASSSGGGSSGGGSRWYYIDGGFAQVQDGSLTLLTEAAVPAENISLQEADAELAEANARVAKSGEDQANVERDQRRAMAKRTIAQQVKARGGAI